LTMSPGVAASLFVLAQAFGGMAPPPTPTPPANVVPAENGRLISVAAARLPPGFNTLPDYAAVMEAVNVSAISYSSDGIGVKGYMAVPKDGEHLPCVIFNRAGNREFGILSDEDAVRVLGGLARRGYVVVASQYRGSARGQGRDEYGGADLDDVLNLIPLLESLPRTDARRLGMIGWQRGGMMTYLALTRTDRISAAVVVSAISDLPEWLEKRPEMGSAMQAMIPRFDQNRDEALTARSAIRWPEKLAPKTPILIFAGGGDWAVSPKQPLDMAAALLAIRHPFRLVMLEGSDRDLREHRAEVDRVTGEWLDRYVRDQKPVPGTPLSKK